MPSAGAGLRRVGEGRGYIGFSWGGPVGWGCTGQMSKPRVADAVGILSSLASPAISLLLIHLKVQSHYLAK